MPLFYFNDLNTELQVMLQIKDRTQAMHALSQRVNANQALNLMHTASMYPNLPNSVLQAGAAIGLPADHPSFATFSQRVAENEQSGWDKILGAISKPFELGIDVLKAGGHGLKAGLRTAFVGFDSALDELVLRPFRTLIGFASQSATNVTGNDRALLDDGISLYDAYKLAGESTGVKAIRELTGGRRVNLGSGFLPGSDLPEQTDYYAQLIREGHTPQSAAAIVTKLKGLPITEIRDREQERLQYLGMPISPGRFVAGTLDRATGSTVFEPGGLPFNFVSGLLDAAVILGFDPADMALARATRFARANKLLHPTGAAFVKAPDHAMARILHKFNPGLVRGNRPSTWATGVQDFNVSQRGPGGLWDVIANNVGEEGWTRNFEILSKHMDVAPDLQLVDRITSLTNPAQIERTLGPRMGTAIRRKPVATSFLGRILTGRDTSLGAFTGRMIGKYADNITEAEGALFGFQYAVRHTFGQNKLGRMLSRSPSRMGVSVDNINEGAKHLNDWMFQLGLSAKTRGSILQEFAGTRQGNTQGAYSVIRKAARRVRADLVKKGVPKEHAERLTRIMDRRFENLDEARQYAVDMMGKPLWFPGAELMFLTDGSVMIKPSAHALAEHTTRFIPLPDPAGIRRVQSKMRRLFTADDYNERWVTYAMDKWMDNFWKPSVLLRVAWPMRVIGEEMVRMAAAGYDSAFNHPARWLAWVMARPAKWDSTGQLVDAGRGKGALSEIELSLEMQAAHSRVTGLSSDTRKVRGPRKALLANDAYTMHEFEDIPEWFEDWSFELGQLWYDEVAPIIAQMTPNYSATVHDSVVDWFMYGEGRKFRERLAREGQEFQTKTGEVASQASKDRILFGNEDAWLLAADDPAFAAQVGMNVSDQMARAASEAYLNSLWARMHQMAGGEFKFHEAKNVFKKKGAQIRGTYEVTKYGDTRIMDSFATGKIATGPNTFMDLQDIRRSKSHKPFKKVAGLLQDRYKGSAPRFVKKRVGGALDVDKGRYNAFVDRMFSMLMGQPTNKLARAPLFRQIFWEDIERLATRTKGKARAELVQLAQKGNMDAKYIARLANAPVTTSAVELIDNAEDVIDLAKARGLQGVRDLLYDLSQRSAAADILRNITPFAEAWWEIFSTWSKIVTHNPRIIRRSQQIYEGFREGDPFNTGNGFFHVDPQTGQEVFTYPLLGGLVAGISDFGGPTNDPSRSPGTFDPGLGPGAAPFQSREGLTGELQRQPGAKTPLEFTGSVQGLNLFAGSVIPGFGPVVQFPTSLLLPDTPGTDYIRQTVLPFGEIGLGELVTLRALPAAWRKFLGPLTEGDPAMERLQNNTTIEIYRSLILSGSYDVAARNPDGTPNLERRRREMREALEQAKRSSNWMMMLRGLAQFVTPSAPAPRYQVEISEKAGTETAGQVFAITTLAQEYRQKVDELGGDDLEATNWFIGKYGIEPTIFATPKTTLLRARPLTQSGDNFQRLNPDLFSKVAPLTAYYAQPDDPDEEFDYPAYLRQLEEGTRISLTPEQWAERRNQLLGSLRYDVEKNRPEVIAARRKNPRAAQIYLRAQRLYLMQAYPGYNRPIEGYPQKANIEMLIEEFETAWVTDERLSNSPLNPALQAYLARRREADAFAQEQLGLAPGSFASAQSAAPIRAWLRQWAEYLKQTNPYFMLPWQFVFSRELLDDTAFGTISTTPEAPTESDYLLVGIDPPAGTAGDA